MSNLDLINSLTIDTLYSSKEFALMHGDISQVEADLLVVSTHAGKGKPRGAVLESLTKRYGELDFRSMLKILSFTEDSYFQTKAVHPYLDMNINLLAPPPNAPFHNILMIRMPSPAHFPTTEEALSVYEKAMTGIFSSIAMLEFNGHCYKTIALPLLGGARAFPKQKIMSIILKSSIEWLKYSAHTQQIIFTIYEDAQIGIWNEVMNSSLGRTVLGSNKYEDAITALRRTFQKRSHAYVNNIRNEAIREVLQSLARSLSNDHIYVEQLGMYGRKLAEAIAAQMCNDLGFENCHDTVFANIEKIAKSKRISKWIKAYLDCLRVLGNESVHVANNELQRVPKHLSEGDLLVIFSNILSVLDFYMLWRGKDHTKD